MPQTALSSWKISKHHYRYIIASIPFINRFITLIAVSSPRLTPQCLQVTCRPIGGFVSDLLTSQRCFS